MRFLGYIRVSTEDQAANGHSLGVAQPDALAAIARQHGGTLVGVVVDGGGEGEDFRGVSGGLPIARRPGGAELVARLQAGEADGVIAYSLERMFRDVDDGRAFFRTFAIKRGVRVITQTEGPVDPNTVSGWTLINQILLFGELERLRTAERTRYTSQALRRAGKVYGDVPFGCTARDGQLFRDPTHWEMREEIVRQRAEGKPYQAISDALRRLRVPAPNCGARWAKSTIQRICDSHDSLAHLPIAGKPACVPSAAPEVAASQGGSADGRL